MKIRNSQNSPLQIAEVLLEPGQGVLGLTLCPGKKDPGRQWDRDLAEDLRVIKGWGATVIVTLLEPHEFAMLAVEALGRDAFALGMDWLHLPILDVSVPDQRFEDGWALAGTRLHQRLDEGERILIHCRGGLGRTGLVAGRILVERGSKPEAAIQRVRAVRPNAIETRAQEQYVRNAVSGRGSPLTDSSGALA